MAPPNLKNELKKKLISISARAIKTWMYYPDRMIYLKISTKWKIELCQMPSRPTNVPFNFSNFTMIMKCRLTGLISTLIKIFTTRQTTFSIECIFLDNFIYRNMFEINYSQFIQYEILEKLVTYIKHNCARIGKIFFLANGNLKTLNLGPWGF